MNEQPEKPSVYIQNVLVALEEATVAIDRLRDNLTLYCEERGVHYIIDSNLKVKQLSISEVFKTAQMLKKLLS